MTVTEHPADTRIPLASDAIIGEKQGFWFLPALVIAWLGATLTTVAISGATIPKFLTLLDSDTKEARLAAISAAGGVVVMIVTPLFGRLSDRTMARWGMRKPWCAGGIAVGALGTVLCALAREAILLGIGWCVVQIGFGAVMMALHSLLADQVPGRIRARVAAAVGVSSGIATIGASAIVASLPIHASWSWFLMPGLIGALTVTPLLFAYRDARRETPAPPLRLGDILSTYWLNPRRYRDFAFAWCSRFFMTMAIFSVSLFMFFLIVDTLHVSAEQAGGVQTTALACYFVGNIVATVFFGWLSDRLHRRKIIVWTSGAITVVGLFVVMLSTGMPMFLVGMTIVGFAQGGYLAVDVALMTEVLPSVADAGKDLGIVALSYQLPQVVAPIVGAGIIALAGGSYQGLFWFAIGSALIGAVAIIPVRGVK